MNATNLSPTELQALSGISRSDFMDRIDGKPTAGHHVWRWSGNTFASKRTYSGACSSLQRKGLIVCEGGSGEDSCIALTQAGVDAYLAHQAARAAA